MGKPRKVGRIEVDEDRAFLEKEWRFQRISWILIGLLLVAAIAGAFGRGPISESTTGDPATFAADHSRITRHAATEQLTLRVGPSADSIFQIAISRDYVRAHELVFITPQPITQIAAGEFYVYRFIRSEPQRPARIEMQIRPLGYGPTRAHLLLGTTRLTIQQFILP